ncbi:MAG: DUF1622 domain-containing protein [Lachnospiraceae bacterium]
MLETVMEYLVEVAILIFEFMGVGIIIFSGLKGFYHYVRRSPEMKVSLAQGLAIGLEFKLGSEILKTVIVREWTEIVTVAGIIALRAALTFLIHWEIKEEHKDKLEHEKEVYEAELREKELHEQGVSNR